MPIALNRKRLTPYVLEAERAREAGEQTKFLIRTLGVEAAAEAAELVRPFTSGDAINMLDFIRAMKRICALGLGGWDNFRDADGVQVVFATEANGQPSSEALDVINADALQELALAIVKENSLTGEDRGN